MAHFKASNVKTILSFQFLNRDRFQNPLRNKFRRKILGFVEIDELGDRRLGVSMNDE